MHKTYTRTSIFSPFLLLLALAPWLGPARAAANASQVAAAPPMGWSSWNTFGKEINEQLIHQASEALVSSGMKDAGYNYVNLDDGWQLTQRDQNGNLQWDTKKFPSGMKALGDYLHARGLLFGIYTSAGVQTCMRYEGSYDHEQQDVRQFASWGVDFVKVDWCCTHPSHLTDKHRGCPRSDPHDYGNTGQKELYQRWALAVSQTSRPMLLSICEWGTGKPWVWAPAMGNMWRTTEDIVACRDCKKSWWGLGWEPILDQQVGLEGYSGPGHWNDPDMLIVGVKNLDERDAQAHFSFWCMLAAPLIAGNDPRNMTESTHRILTNREAIAVDQDALGKQGHRVLKTISTEVWARPLANRGEGVLLFNRSNRARTVAFTDHDLGLKARDGYKMNDLWEHHALGSFTGRFQRIVPAHEVVFITMFPETPAAGH